MKYYIQSTGKTSGPASLMAVINHFKPDFELSRENEFRIWRESANLPVLASSIYGLAVFARKQGLNPTIVLQNPDFYYPNYRFMGYKKKDIDNAKYSSEIQRKEAHILGITVEERDFDLKEVKSLLKQEKIVLLRVNEGALRKRKSVSKYVVVYQFKEGNFFVVDPHQGIMRVSEAVLKEAFDTLETKNKRDHRMIVFE